MLFVVLIAIVIVVVAVAVLRKPDEFHAVRSIIKPRGFTLTEIAIVLGIIGVILGAIWVASAAVYRRQRIEKAQQELLLIVSNIRQLYANSPTFGYTTPANDVTTSMINAGVFPPDMINPSFSWPVTPWGGSVVIWVTPNSPGADGTQFEIRFSTTNPPGIAQSNSFFPCIDLLTQTASSAQGSGLLYIYDNVDGWQSTAAGNLGPNTFKNCTGDLGWTYTK